MLWLIAAWLIVAPSPAQGECAPADGVRIVAESEPPPAGLPAEARERLSGSGIRLTVDGRLVARFWGALPEPDGARSDARGPNAGIPLPGSVRLLEALRPGALLGALWLDEPRTDASGKEIVPGLWLLRYVVQPGFKDHIGTAPYRDFALLLDPTVDSGSTLDQPAALALAPPGHPPVVQLLPTGPDALPSSCGGRLRIATRAAGLELALDLGGLGTGILRSE